MPKQWLQYPVVTIDPALLAREATLQQVRDNLTNGTQKSQRIDGSGNVSPAGDVPARGEYVRPTDGTNTQGYTATGEAKVSVTQPLPTGSNGIGSVSVSASALPTGASTSANQTNGTQQTQIVQGGNTALVSPSGGLLVAGLSAVGVAPASNPVSISGVDGGGLKRNILTDTSGRVEINTAQSLPLPSGASTETTLAAISAKLPTSIGQKTSAASLGVVFASDQSALPAATRTPVGFVRNNYNTATGGTNVTSGAYVQLFASTSAATSLMEIFDSSGQTLKIAFGAAASEVDQFLVFPGGNGPIAVKVPVSTRVSIRAVTGSAVSGEIDINLYG